MMRFFAVLAALGISVLGACTSATFDDPVYPGLANATGGAVSVVDAPVAFVGQNWASVHERDAKDITLADLPGFAFGITDPFNVAPPPIGTFYVPWKLFVTVLRAFPFVTYPRYGESGGMVTWISGQNPGPVWYAVGGAIEDLDGFILPVQETVAKDHTPVPGNGVYGQYWRSRVGSHMRHLNHAAHTLKYMFLGSNSLLPPYDNWFPDTLSRQKTTMHKTFDTFLFHYDWDDPYVN